MGLIAAIRAGAQGNQTVLPVYQYDAASQTIVAVPVSLGSETDQVHLVIYGTGIRNVKALTSVTAQVGGTSVPVTYAAQSEFQGLDQVNVGPLPRTLAGKGAVAVVITVDGNRSNSVTLTVQ